MRRKMEKIILGVTAVFVCGTFVCEDREFSLHKLAERMYYPAMYCVSEKQIKGTLGERIVKNFFPLYDYWKENTPSEAETEDSLTYELLLSQQAQDEYTVDAVQEETMTEYRSQTAEIDMEKLRDFNYLLSQYYTVDSTTTIGAEQLNADDLLSRSMKIDQTKNGPKILIFHTHSQEAFADSTSNTATTIVGMGRYLSELLNAKGIETIHHDGVYDLIQGKLDRSKAYQMAEAGVKEILNQNPSIEVVIDLHRDGVPDTTHLVTEVNGKKVGKIMFFNGLSRTKKNGDIAYLKNPYIQENLSFSFQMQLAAQQLYPGFTRRIYLKGYRYSLHMMPKSLLIEAGAQTNTVEEMKNSMELLANVLVEVLL